MKLIPFTSNVYISEKHEVLLLGERPKGFHIGKNTLTLRWRDRLITKPRWWWYQYADFRFPEFIDPDDISFIKLTYKNSRKPYRPKFSKPYVVFGKYRICPMGPRYAIDENGNIINATTGQPYKSHIKSGNLPYRKFKMPDVYAGVHVLVANAWIDKDQDTNHPIVNHIDSNPANNNVSNLEWVDYKGNSQHAKRAGRLDQVRCWVRDITTGKTTFFLDIKSAASYLNVGEIELYHNKENGLNQIFNSQYEIRYENLDIPWQYPIGLLVMNPDEGSRYRFWVTEKGTRKQMVFHGRVALSRHFCLWKRRSDNTSLGAGPEIIKEFNLRFGDKFVIQLEDRQNTFEVEAKNIETQEVLTFPTALSAAAHFGVGRHMIDSRIKLKNGKSATLFGKWILRRKTDAPWNVEICKPMLPHTVHVIYYDGSTKDFPSVAQAAQALGISRDIIFRRRRDDREDITFDLRLIHFTQPKAALSRNR